MAGEELTTLAVPPETLAQAEANAPEYPRRVATELVGGKQTVLLEFDSAEEAQAAASPKSKVVEEPHQSTNGWRVRLRLREEES